MHIPVLSGALWDMKQVHSFCAYFCSGWSIVGYGTGAFWDLRIRSVGLEILSALLQMMEHHDDVNKWKHFPRYWPFVRGIHRSPVNSPHKGQWREWWGWWFETPSGPLWRHRNDHAISRTGIELSAMRFLEIWTVFTWKTFLHGIYSCPRPQCVNKLMSQ